MDIIDVYRILYPTITQYILFSSPHGTFFKIDRIIGHKGRLSKYKKVEIIPCILSDHNALKLEPNKNSSRRYTNNWKLNNTSLNEQ
jgi:hypothetical protein